MTKNKEPYEDKVFAFFGNLGLSPEEAKSRAQNFLDDLAADGVDAKEVYKFLSQLGHFRIQVRP